MSSTISNFAVDAHSGDDGAKGPGRHSEHGVRAQSRVLRRDRARETSRWDRNGVRLRKAPSRASRKCMLEALMDKLGDLSDDELIVRLRGHVGKGHVWLAELIAYLVEVEERRLDRLHACSSMWDF